MRSRLCFLIFMKKIYEKICTNIFLFKVTFLISCISFGGGYVIMPMMKKYFVEQMNLMSECELLDLYAIAQTAPGAIAVNSSVLVGYHIAGKTGALISSLGTILPPFIAISLIAQFYSGFVGNVYITKILAGMAIGVAAVMIEFLLNMLQIIWKEKSVFLLGVTLVSFLAVEFLDVNVALILILSAVISSLKYTIKEKIEEKKKCI